MDEKLYNSPSLHWQKFIIILCLDDVMKEKDQEGEVMHCERGGNNSFQEEKISEEKKVKYQR